MFFYQNQAFSLNLPPNGTFKTVKMGNTLTSILTDANWTKTDIAKVLQHKEASAFTLYPNSEYYVCNTNNKQLVVFFEAESDNALIFQKKNAATNILYEEINYDTRVVTVKGKVVGSLQASIVEKVPSTLIAQRFMNAYVMDFNLKKSLQKNAPFQLTYEKKYLGNRLIKYGQVLQASLEIDGKMVERDFVTFAKGGAFIDPLGISKKPLYAPVEYLNISSLFQPRRRHPITKRVIPHMGIDFELPVGAPVYAVAGGVVARTGRNRAAGKFVVIRHPNGLETFYNHLSAFHVRDGQNIKPGDKIAAIGCTGYCTKAHLHFAVKKHGKFTDPSPYVRPYPYHKRTKIEDYRISANSSRTNF